MPILTRDDYSGALIFCPTPEEQAVSDLRSELEDMKLEMQQKLSQLDDIIKGNTVGVEDGVIELDVEDEE